MDMEVNIAMVNDWEIDKDINIDFDIEAKIGIFNWHGH